MLSHSYDSSHILNLLCQRVLWQQTGGKAVAFFDYEMDMRRIMEDVTLRDGVVESRACVTTPKDAIQCV